MTLAVFARKTLQAILTIQITKQKVGSMYNTPPTFLYLAGLVLSGQKLKVGLTGNSKKLNQQKRSVI